MERMSDYIHGQSLLLFIKKYLFSSNTNSGQLSMPWFKTNKHKCDFIFSISFYIWKESGCSVWEEMGVAHLGCYWRCCPSINLLIWGLMGHVIPEKATSLSEE